MTLPRQSLHPRRAARARELAERYPASAEGLRFIAAVIDEQARVGGDIVDRSGAAGGETAPGGPTDLNELTRHSRALVDLVLREGPSPLRSEAEQLDEERCREALDRFARREDTTSPLAFFARVLWQAVWATRLPHPRNLVGAPEAGGTPGTSANCSRCGHAPQLGVVRPVGDGSEFRLVCSLCLGEWSFPRNGCPACGESEEGRIAYYGAADEFAHLQVRACESCRGYLLQVDASKEPRAVPDIDEMAGLPLDVWARGQDLRKLVPNLLGI